MRSKRQGVSDQTGFELVAHCVKSLGFEPAGSLNQAPGSNPTFHRHSWHDLAGQKWAALHSWAVHFQSSTGRPPNVWLGATRSYPIPLPHSHSRSISGPTLTITPSPLQRHMLP